MPVTLKKNELVKWKYLIRLIKLYINNPLSFLKLQDFCTLVVNDRLDDKQEKLFYDNETQNIVEGTINKNKSTKYQSIGAERSQRLINPLLSISRINKEKHNLKVLSIGPRNEAELLTLMGNGFYGKNIHAVDLFSTSDWIDTGDMHNLSYDDNSFDIVLAGWVFAYSNNHQAAADEISRITKSGGYISIGWDAIDDPKNIPEYAKLGTHRIDGSENIKELFENTINTVIFQGILDRAQGEHVSQIIFTAQLK